MAAQAFPIHLSFYMSKQWDQWPPKLSQSSLCFAALAVESMAIQGLPNSAFVSPSRQWLSRVFPIQLSFYRPNIGSNGRPGRFQSNFCFAAFVLPSRQWANCRPDFPNPACTLTPRQWNQSPSRVFQIHLCYAVHGSGNIGRPGLSQSSICFAALVLQSRQWDQLPFRLSQSSSCFALHGSGTNDRPEPLQNQLLFCGPWQWDQ